MNEPATQSTELNCEQCRELLSGYIDREITAAEHQAVEKHLASCPRCATESTHMVGLKNVVQHWNGIEGSTEFQEVVIDKMITESQMMPSKQFTDAAEKARSESAQQLPPASERASWLWILVGVVMAAALAIAVFMIAQD